MVLRAAPLCALLLATPVADVPTRDAEPTSGPDTQRLREEPLLGGGAMPNQWNDRIPFILKSGLSQR